ncbi:MAG: hypothetical protein J5889_07385 [Clostridia bacterium]|nr:hypothetical protein [Clostridia bacterium]
MMNIIDAVKDFDGQRNRCRNLYLAFGIGAVAILALMGLTEIKFAFIVIPLILIVYYVIVKPTFTQYARKWQEYCVQRFMEMFEPVTFSYRANAEEIPLLREHLLMPEPTKGKLFARCLATGRCSGIKATALDATVPDNRGGRTTFVSGCWLGQAFESAVPETIYAVKGEMTYNGEYERWLGEQGLKPCTVSAELTEGVVLYSVSGDAELPEEAYELLDRLMRDAPYTAAVEFARGGLFMFLPHRLLIHQPPSLKEPVTDKTIRQMEFPEIEDAYRLALAVKK